MSVLRQNGSGQIKTKQSSSQFSRQIEGEKTFKIFKKRILLFCNEFKAIKVLELFSIEAKEEIMC